MKRLMPVLIPLLSFLSLAACQGGSASTMKLVQKSVELYTGSDGTHSSIQLAFQSDATDIPLVPLDFIASSLEKAYTPAQTTSVSYSGKKATITFGSSDAVIDFDAKTLTLTYEDFFAAPWTKSALDIVSETGFDAAKNPCYLSRTRTVIHPGKSTTYDLGAYSIPMTLQDGVGYIPLTTASDLLLAPNSLLLAYSGVAAFLETNPQNFGSAYYDVTPGAKSQALAEYNYHELCLFLDSNYGIQKQHGISSFDDLLTTQKQKDDLLSTDSLTSYKAFLSLLLGDLDEGHTAPLLPSPYVGSSPKVSLIDYIGASRYNREVIYATYKAARKAQLGESIPAYQVVGDTAYLTFDQFMARTQDYYTLAPSLEAAAGDTFDLVAYAHKQIMAQGSGIANVVIDLSCNGGGAADAAAYIASWALGGSSTFHVASPFSGASGSFTYAADTNLDHKFDASDVLVGKKVYCLESPYSFSCGNLLPCLFKDSGKVTLLGKRSGGGTCVLQPTVTADGNVYWTSGPRQMSKLRSGYYADIDQGAEPDYALASPSDFFNRASLTAYIDSL